MQSVGEKIENRAKEVADVATRCKICNKVASGTLFNGVCAKCMCAETKKENELIEQKLYNEDDGFQSVMKTDLNKKGGFAECFRTSLADHKSEMSTGVEERAEVVKPESKKDELDTIKLVGEFTQKDKRAYRPLFQQLYKKYGVFFKRGEYFICKKSCFGGDVVGDIVEEKANLLVLKRKAYLDPDHVMPDSYMDDNEVIESYDDDADELELNE